jgi:hypothetical protein
VLQWLDRLCTRFRRSSESRAFSESLASAPAEPVLTSFDPFSSPISLLVATLLLSLWRPIMEELASAISVDGANYSYL